MTLLRSSANAGLILAILLAASTSMAVPGATPHARADGTAELADHVPGAHVLEGRILAPCCWNQTIDIHGSEISNELRREIRQRLAAGESVDAVQASIVTRYGERILAVPPGNPLKQVAVLLSVLFGAAGVGAIYMLRRWRKRAGAREPQAGTARRDELDDRIDAELERLDA
jgi:cytochrome c-type biogenesis protein CcmH